MNQALTPPPPSARTDGYARTSMPIVSAWIDAMREAFGTRDVDAWIRNGRAAGTFYAAENGHTVGAPIPAPENAITADRMVLQAPASVPSRAKR